MEGPPREPPSPPLPISDLLNYWFVSPTLSLLKGGQKEKEQSRVNPLSLSAPVENRVKVTSETNLLQLEKAKEIRVLCNLPAKYCSVSDTSRVKSKF